MNDVTDALAAVEEFAEQVRRFSLSAGDVDPAAFFAALPVLRRALEPPDGRMIGVARSHLADCRRAGCVNCRAHRYILRAAGRG